MLGSPLPGISRKSQPLCSLLTSRVVAPLSPKFSNAYTDFPLDLISLYILPTNLILFTLSPT